MSVGQVPVSLAVVWLRLQGCCYVILQSHVIAHQGLLPEPTDRGQACPPSCLMLTSRMHKRTSGLHTLGLCQALRMDFGSELIESDMGDTLLKSESFGENPKLLHVWVWTN